MCSSVLSAWHTLSYNSLGGSHGHYPISQMGKLGLDQVTQLTVAELVFVPRHWTPGSQAELPGHPGSAGSDAMACERAGACLSALPSPSVVTEGGQRTAGLSSPLQDGDAALPTGTGHEGPMKQ